MTSKILEQFNAAADAVSGAVRVKINEIGQAESARMAGLAASDVSAWIAGKRRWTLEKQAVVMRAISQEEKIF